MQQLKHGTGKFTACYFIILVYNLVGPTSLAFSHIGWQLNFEVSFLLLNVKLTERFGTWPKEKTLNGDIVDWLIDSALKRFDWLFTWY